MPKHPSKKRNETARQKALRTGSLSGKMRESARKKTTSKKKKKSNKS